MIEWIRLIDLATLTSKLGVAACNWKLVTTKLFKGNTRLRPESTWEQFNIERVDVAQRAYIRQGIRGALVAATLHELVAVRKVQLDHTAMMTHEGRDPQGLVADAQHARAEEDRLRCVGRDGAARKTHELYVGLLLAGEQPMKNLPYDVVALDIFDFSPTDQDARAGKQAVRTIHERGRRVRGAIEKIHAEHK